MTNTDKRKYERVATNLAATLSILIPEETFSPVTNGCEVIDISERGAMVQISLAPESYSQMLQKTRFCRLEFQDTHNLPKRLTGRAVWLQPQGSLQNRSYKVGLFFEDCPPEIVSQLQNYVNHIKNSKADATG